MTTGFPNLAKLGFTDFLKEPVNFTNVQDVTKINIGTVLELNQLKEFFNYSNNELLTWLLQLNSESGGISAANKDTRLRTAKLVSNYKQKYTQLNKSKSVKGKQALDEFLCTQFDYDLLSSSCNSRKRAKSESHCSEYSVGLKTSKFETESREENHVVIETLKDVCCYWKEEAGKLTIKNQELIQEINNERTVRKEVKVLQKQLIIKERSKQFVQSKYRAENKRLRERVRYWENLSNKYKRHLQESKTDFEHEKEELTNRIEDYERNLEEKEAEINIIRGERDNVDLESREVSFTRECKNGKYTYTSSTDLCVMRLLDSHVPFEHVEKVIRNVLDLCHLNVKDSLPKKDYVAKVNARRLALGQIHAAEVIDKAENCTLYTDETRKDGQSYGSFVVTDENKDPVLLGLRHMSNKASRTELDTFKSILDDVHQRCESLSPTNDEVNMRYEVLRKITSTMSDRAATEVSFKELLLAYRSDLMKGHIDNFDLMTPEEQLLLTRMFNFFCGLHLLVNIAELMDGIFKQWESTRLGTESQESGILRVVRNASKAFAPGADNKNGAYLEFSTYIRRKGVHNLQVKSFLGNRFNIVFHNGGVIYCLSDHIVSFLEDVKSEGKPSSLNWLLTSVLSDLKVNEHVVGLRALGIFNKFITAPLWKLLECKTLHILDMNKHYQGLVEYLECVATSVEKAGELLTGEYVPFSVEVKKDAAWVALVSQSGQDALTVSLLMQMCAGVCKLLKEKVKDHLDGGRYHDIDESRDALKSVLPHNKLPEWVFGYLYWLLKHRPNSTRLANEAHIVFQVYYSVHNIKH